MKVKIFTEGGRDIGLGHISRCSSLYDEVKSRGIDVELFVYGDLGDSSILSNKKVRKTNWLSVDYLKEEIDLNDYCIIDSYLASKDVYEVISNKSKKALYIDDTGRIRYPAGIVVNPCLNTDKIKYEEDSKITYLLGRDYIILRTPFINTLRKKLNEEVKEVLIIMGGSDIRNLTPKIIINICKKHPAIKFNVVVGKDFENTYQGRKLDLPNVNYYENIDENLMKELMLKSDLAITAAGQTIYELLATQTPFIPIKVIENQEGNMQGLLNMKFISDIFYYKDDFLLRKLEKEFKKLLEYKYRKKKVCFYTKAVDGFGRKKIIEKLLDSWRG